MIPSHSAKLWSVLGLLVSLSGCGFGLQKLEELAVDTGALNTEGNGNNGNNGSGNGSGNSGSGTTDTGLTGGGSGSGGDPWQDADGDGYIGSEDCDDTDPRTYPGAVEVCDGSDNDCDGWTDTDDVDLVDGRTGYRDSDADGWGLASDTSVVCPGDTGWATTPGDCDDARATVNPGATDDCSNGVDDDCDGIVDNGPGCTRSITGGFVILYGVGQFLPGSYNCGLLWNLSGTEDPSACPSCDFAFNLSATYDGSVSFTDGSCTGMTNFTTTWAYDSDYYGGTPYFLEYYAGSWNPITSDTSFNPATGDWEWSAGLIDYYYGLWPFSYYYTYYQYMVATVY